MASDDEFFGGLRGLGDTVTSACRAVPQTVLSAPYSAHFQAQFTTQL